MKRSEINKIMQDADVFIRQNGFHLPPFAYWTPSDWATRGPEAREIVERQLGWDITDFGQGDFRQTGLFLFTIRNGALQELKNNTGKVYAEKIMVVESGQKTPMHFHWSKTEDIINRGGGRLIIQLYNSTADEQLADSDINISMDGVCHTVKAGEFVTLSPGESITLPTGCYHEFWGDESRVLVGEVSAVNDDNVDNRFYKPVGRFPVVEEDQPPLYYLTSDYQQHLSWILTG
jgi:hypothetical protein